jgi:hypothetical protein
MCKFTRFRCIHYTINVARPLIEIGDEINDWMKTDSTKASFGPVTDQRWESNCFVLV